jgi:hypothetical protein
MFALTGFVFAIVQKKALVAFLNKNGRFHGLNIFTRRGVNYP